MKPRDLDQISSKSREFLASAIKPHYNAPPPDIAALVRHLHKPIPRWLMTWQRRVRMVVAQEQ
jgi:hypothetical protein